MFIGNKKGASSGKGATTAIVILFSVIALVLLGIVVSWSIDRIGALNIPEPSPTTVFVSYLNNDYVQPLFVVLFGEQALQTDQLFVIVLAILFIMLFAFSDILKMFSTFSEATSWVIAVALTFIMSALGITKVIISALGITAAAGLYIVLIMIMTAFIAALIINLGFGQQLQEWALRRKAAQDALKAGKSAADIKTAVDFLRSVKSTATNP